MSATNHMLAGPCGLLPAAKAQQQGMSPFALEAGSVSPPASSCSTGTALGVASGSRSTGATPANSHSDGAGAGNRHHHGGHGHQRPQQQQQGVASMMAGHVAAAGPASYCPSREWLYRLVTFPAYFTPCVNCCNGCRTPKREQLMTLFDTKFPHKVYCSHCPECQVTGGASLLQVRRASFKDVVKATDIARFGADVSGVQQYTLNGSKVIYLNREAAQEKKPNNNGNTAPAMCTVDGRAMMDKSSLYCSLKCKMQAEDAGFTSWLDSQDPAVRIMADIAANAPPRPTVACKRGAAPTSSGSSGGSAATESGSSAGRPKKQARTTSSGGNVGAAAGAPAGQGTGDESAAPAAAARAAKQRASTAMQRAASAPQGAPAGLKPIKTSLPGSGSRTGGSKQQQQAKAQHQHQPALLLLGSSAAASRQASAPSAFLEAAMAEPQLGCLDSSSRAAAAAAPRTSQAAAAAAAPIGMSCSSWLAGPNELDNALSSNSALGSWDSWGSWQGGMGSPSFALGVHDAWEDGSLSPALLPAPAAVGLTLTEPPGTAGGCFGGLGGSVEDWWLPGSPAGAFASAGLAGF